MLLAVNIIGIVLVLIAVGYFLKPDGFKSLIEFYKKGERIYLAALVRFALGVVFLLAARECSKPVVISVLGIAFLIGGMTIVIVGPEKVNKIIGWYQNRSKIFSRFMALLLFAFGILIVYSA